MTPLGRQLNVSRGRCRIWQTGKRRRFWPESLSEMVDAVVVRSKSHKTLTDLAETLHLLGPSTALTDRSHPCQTLADLFHHPGDFWLA